MMLTILNAQTPVPPPAYHRAQAKLGPALHIDALSLVTTLHLLSLCHLAHRHCPPPLKVGPGGAPRTYSEESLLLLALLRTLWRLSHEDVHDWLQDWPALALACGLPMGEDVPVFPVLRNSASADNALERRCQRHCLCSVC